MTNHTQLTNFLSQGNVLQSLYIANGNNTNFTNFDTTVNPNLGCIEVDDATWSTANWFNKDTVSIYSEDCSFCVVNIPDANLKAYLLNHIGINRTNGSEIECYEAAAFTGAINCQSLSITDLTGIEAFTTLTELRCNNNQLSSLDVSNNTNLTFLNADSNNLTSIDVTNNTQLDFFHIAENNLTSLDITNNTALTSFSIRSNNIANLDITNNTLLEVISIEGNSLTSLDVSAHTSLTYLNAKSNQLTSLNVKNGNNTNLTNFWSTGNPNLSCVEVDNVAWSTANWTNIDGTTSFSENCAALSVDEFNETTNFTVFPNPSTGIVTIESKSVIQEILIYDLQGRIVTTSIPNRKSVQMIMPSLQKGIYLIQLKSEKSISSKQLVIQ